MSLFEQRLLARKGWIRLNPWAVILGCSVVLTGLIFVFSAGVAGCSKGESWARAKKITTRSELIGGPNASGEVGDFLLENDRIRVIIQGSGFSRGYGKYGGALIDADLQRPLGPGDQSGGRGKAQFGELFHLFFIQVMNPYRVSVLSDGSDGGPARIVSRGEPGEFLSLTKTLNHVLLNSHELGASILDPRQPAGPANLEYETIYELRPGDRHVKMTTRVVNVSGRDLEIPSPVAQMLLDMLFDDLTDFDVPMGTVILFATGNDVFAPGFGFDLPMSLLDSHRADLAFPAIPGLITSSLATASEDGVSYGFFVEPMEDGGNFVASRLNESGESAYEEVYDVEVGPDSMLMPFLTSSVTAFMHAQAPRMLERGSAFEIVSYFSIGDGDVASASEPMYQLRGVDTGMVRGSVVDEISLQAVDGASVVVLDADGRPFSQMYSRDGGRFRARLPEGQYSAVVEHDPVVSSPVPFTVRSGETSVMDLARPGSARIAVRVFDEAGQKLPARVTVVGTVDSEREDDLPRNWLFDLSVGQRWRTSSFVSEDPDSDAPIRYIENEAYTRDGVASVKVRPGGPYTVYVSRGMEYDLESFQIADARAGTRSAHKVVLKRSVDTSGYVSSDLHLHTWPSHDSNLDIEARVWSAAGEGLEFIAATDHNVITDYQPYIERAGLEQWIASMRGVELTTMEGGHINAFPLDRDPGHMVKGAPVWADKTPDEMFGDLRDLGTYGPDETIILANHPRDSIFGYFSQYGLDPLSAEIPEWGSGGMNVLLAPTGPAFFDEDGKSTFSFDFDAIELLGGKRIDQLRSVRVPDDLAGYDLCPEFLEELPPAGTVLCDDSGEVAWPGTVDDWFNFLNLGRRYAAVATSDSHTAKDGSTGSARSYIWVGHDDPRRLNERDIIRGIFDKRVILTNGPFVELFVNGGEIGSELVSETGDIEVLIRIQVANWVHVNRATLYGNGRVMDSFDVTPSRGRFEVTINLELEEDTWLVVEVEGDRQLFPVIPPIETPPLELGEAFVALADPFGFAAGELTELLPKRMGPVTAYALTNPIWVDVGGDGFTPPGLPWRECRGFELVEDFDREWESKKRSRVASPSDLLVPSLWFPRVRGDLEDFRSLLDQFRD